MAVRPTRVLKLHLLLVDPTFNRPLPSLLGLYLWFNRIFSPELTVLPFQVIPFNLLIPTTTLGNVTFKEDSTKNLKEPRTAASDGLEVN
ncbi:hypothetical protein CEXT_20551 [Caerostris extrusa]|uniref:Uncharacterized protein n=1 Tax=Caerostris extrusa TaxID=172846 RepID=A0AAV4QU24_CAEEX|nr:hypothetical protein CEXT_20551 [Caerostris extrusa]